MAKYIEECIVTIKNAHLSLIIVCATIIAFCLQPNEAKKYNNAIKEVVTLKNLKQKHGESFINYYHNLTLKESRFPFHQTNNKWNKDQNFSYHTVLRSPNLTDSLCQYFNLIDEGFKVALLEPSLRGKKQLWDSIALVSQSYPIIRMEITLFIPEKAGYETGYYARYVSTEEVQNAQFVDYEFILKFPKAPIEDEKYADFHVVDSSMQYFWNEKNWSFENYLLRPERYSSTDKKFVYNKQLNSELKPLYKEINSLFIQLNTPTYIFLPYLQSFKSEVQSKTFDQAIEYLLREREKKYTDISLLGITVKQQVIVFGAGLVSISIMVFLLNHLIWLKKISLEKKIELTIPWSGFFTNRIGRLFTFFTIFLLPLSNVWLFLKYQSYLIESTGIIIILSILLCSIFILVSYFIWDNIKLINEKTSLNFEGASEAE